MMNFQDKLQTNAPSIRYEGDIRPEQAQLRQQQAQAMQQMQQQAMMQQPQGRMPAGRMPPMAMGGSITGPTIQGQNGIAGLNMPGYAYGGITGQDGRKQYGIGSWFQEKIMDPIKKNPVAAATIAALGVNQFGIPGTGGKGVADNFGRGFIGDIFGRDSILGPGGEGDPVGTSGPQKNKKLINLSSIMSDSGQKGVGNTPFGLSTGMLSAIGGGVAGLFSDRLNSSEDAEADRGVGIGINNVGQAANVLDPREGMAAGLRFLPELETRKYSPAQMLAAYGGANQPVATADLADGGRAFDIPDYSYKNKMMDPNMMEQIKRLIQGGMGKGMGRGDMEKSVLMRMPDMTMGYAEGGRLDSFGTKQKQLREISKKLQEINQAMMSAEAEELVELMQQAMVLKEQIRQLGASPEQSSEDNVMQAMLSGGSSFEDLMSAPGAESIVDSGYDIYKPDRTKDNYPVEGVSMEEMVSMPNNNNRALMTSGKMDNNFNFSDMMRAGMMRRPSREVNIPSIRMEGDAGSDMGEATMFEEYDKKAEGGIMETEQSEMLDLGGMEKDYREEGGFVPIGEYEKKDDVPARLSVNEFVFTADAVRGAGDGDIDKGAERLQGIMKELEKQGKPEGMEMMEVSERLSEVV